MARKIAYGHEHLPKQCGIQSGTVTVTPTANEVTHQHVTFEEPFAEPPTVVVSLVTTVPYTSARAVSVYNAAADGFDIYLYRVNDTPTIIAWIATGRLQ